MHAKLIQHKNDGNGRQFFSEAFAWATSDGAAVANTTTETIIFPNQTIPANFLQDGRVLRFRAFGKLSTTGTPTIQFGLRAGGVGGTLLWQTEAITNGSGVTNINWGLEVLVVVRSNGASGTVLAMGEVMVNTSTSANVSQVASVSGSDAPATASFDLTADSAFALTAKWGTASASNTLTGVYYTIEALN